MRRLAASAFAVFSLSAVVLGHLTSKQLAPMTLWAYYLACLSAFSLYWFFASFRCYRMLEDTPTSPIGTAPQGYIEINGMAESAAKTPRLSPLVRQPCVWYRYSVEEKRSGGKNTRWVTIDSGESNDSFWVKDSTGRALVCPAGADITPTTSRQWSGSTPRPDTTAAPSFLSSMFDRYRYKEEILSDGFPVHAAGWFETLQSVPDTDREVNDRLRKLKADPAMMLKAADTDQDGHVSVEEWDALRARVRHEVAAASALVTLDPAVHTMTLPFESEFPFVLSGQGEARAIRVYWWWSLVGIVGFLAAGAGGLAVWNRSIFLQ